LLPAGTLFYLLRAEASIPRRLALASSFAAPILLAVGCWKSYTGATLAAGNLDLIGRAFGDGAGLLKGALSRGPSDWMREFYLYHLRFPAHFLVPLFSLRETLRADLLVLLSAGLLGLAALGWLAAVGRGPGLVELWLPFGLALMVLSKPGARYWISFVPYLFYYVLYAADGLGARSRGLRWAFPVSAGSLLIVAACGLALCLSRPDRTRFLSPYWHSYRDLALWARDHTPRDAVLIAPWPAQCYATSLRRSYPLGGLDAIIWPPTRFASEPHVYLVGPPPEPDPGARSETLPDLNPRIAMSNFRELLESGRFACVRREGPVALYVEAEGRTSKSGTIEDQPAEAAR
jgi:hypothetical protein